MLRKNLKNKKIKSPSSLSNELDSTLLVFPYSSLKSYFLNPKFIFKSDMQKILFFIKQIKQNPNLFKELTDIERWLLAAFVIDQNNIKVFNFFIENDLNIDFRLPCIYQLEDMGGMSLLIYATTRGKTKSVDLLIRNKADLSLKDNYGQNALFKAVVYVYPKILALLLTNSNFQKQDKIKALNLALDLDYPAHKKLKILKLLLKDTKIIYNEQTYKKLLEYHIAKKQIFPIRIIGLFIFISALFSTNYFFKINLNSVARLSVLLSGLSLFLMRFFTSEFGIKARVYKLLVLSHKKNMKKFSQIHNLSTYEKKIMLAFEKEISNKTLTF